MTITTKQIVLYFFAIVGLFSCISFIADEIRKEPRLDYNPHHAINGIDTVYTDSIYTIQIKIENAQAYTEENLWIIDRGIHVI